MIIELEPFAIRDVRVEQTGGSPIPGASIEQFGIFPIDNDLSDPLKVAGGYAFLRRSTAATNGRPDPPITPVTVGESLVAIFEGVPSRPWEETSANQYQPIVLGIGRGFTASGRVTSVDASLPLSSAEVQVIGTSSGQRWLSYATAEVHADGTWGPVVAVADEQASYSLKLSGPEIATAEHSVGSVVPGDQVRYDFVAVRGLDLDVVVRDQANATVSGASLHVYWQAGGGYYGSEFSATDAEGRGRLTGIPPGYIQVGALASGFVANEPEWIERTPDDTGPIEIVLNRARSIRGQVRFDGESVEKFTVVWWTSSMLKAGQQVAQSFAGDEEGIFQLESVANESVFLMATAPGFARSPFVRCDLGEDAELVVLELEEPISAHGQVVQAESGQPLSSAVVQLWMNRGQDYVHPATELQRVDAQGRFEFTNLAPGDNRFVIDAPGRARHLGVAFGRSGEVTDLGVIAIPSAKPLTVALSWEGDLDPTQYTARLFGTSHEGPLSFGADGVVTFPDISPGWTRIMVNDAAGLLRRRIVLLLPDREWLFEVPIKSGPILTVVAERADGEPETRLRGGLVYLPREKDSSVPLLESYVQFEFDGEGHAEVRGIPEGPFAIQAHDEEWNTRAATEGVLGPNGTRVAMQLEDRTCTIQVIDRFGEPVPDAEVFALCSGMEHTWNDSAVADEEGLVILRGIPCSRSVVGARHPDHGMAFGVTIDLNQAQGTVQVRLAPSEAIHALLLENGQPSIGTRITLTASGTGYLIGDLTSDGDGRVQWPDVSGDSFDLRVTQPGFWPRRVTIPTATRADPTRVPVFRSTPASLHVRTPGGASIAGRVIELRHVVLDETAEDWVAQGLLDSVLLPLTSDGAGRIELPAVPRGRYTWSSSSAEGVLSSGEFELTGSETIELTMSGN